MKTIEVKTADLTGPALDWAVWLADFGEPGEPCRRAGLIWTAMNEYWSPSTDWSQGGPLIEKHGVELAPPTSEGDWWGAAVWKAKARFLLDGENPLIAACRAIVAAKLGDMVSVPAELVGGAV